jgi:RNA polymerase sigma-70 factor (ECF subfamily)
MAGGETCDPHELTRLVRANDIAALDALNRCHGDRLMAAARRACKSEEDALDAYQDAMVAAGEHLHQYRGDGPVVGWLVRMIVHACHRKRRGGKNDAARHDSEVVVPDQADGPEALAGRAELAELLAELLDELPQRDRAIVVLAETEDWTAPQIAEALEMTPGAVRTRLSRARKLLKDRLEERVPEVVIQLRAGA